MQKFSLLFAKWVTIMIKDKNEKNADITPPYANKVNCAMLLINKERSWIGQYTNHG